MSLAKGAGFPVAQTAHPNFSKLLSDHRVKQQHVRQEIQSRVEALASTVLNEYLQRKPFRAAKADFAQFPTVELSRALKATH